jgi:hypothetical protein
MNHYNPELATGMAANPIPPSDAEVRARDELAAQVAHNYSPDRIDARVALIAKDAAEVRAMRDDSEIRAKSERLAKAIISGIERQRLGENDVKTEQNPDSVGSGITGC